MEAAKARAKAAEEAKALAKQQAYEVECALYKSRRSGEGAQEAKTAALARKNRCE